MCVCVCACVCVIIILVRSLKNHYLNTKCPTNNVVIPVTEILDTRIP